MRTYKEQTALILEKVNKYNSAKKKRMKYIYSLSSMAACILIFFAVYALPAILQNPVTIDPPIVIDPPEIIVPTDPTTPLPTEPVTEESDDAHGGGGPDGCVHYQDTGLSFGESYHTISGIFSFFIYDPANPNAFQEWVKEANKLNREHATEQCGSPYSTMYFFVEYFNIKREDFEKLYYNTYIHSSFYYNIDVLYSGDKDLFEQHHSNFTAEIISEMQSRADFWNAKNELVYETLGIIRLDGETVNKDYDALIRSIDKDNIIGWLEENLNKEPWHNEIGWFYAANSLWTVEEFTDYWSDYDGVPLRFEDLMPAIIF